MIKITTKKVIVRGEKRRKIVDIMGVMPISELPSFYLNTYPQVIKRHERWNCRDICIKQTNRYNIVESQLLVIGDTYDELTFQKVLQVIRKAGDRLHKIRQEEKELKKVWKGEEVFCI